MTTTTPPNQPPWAPYVRKDRLSLEAVMGVSLVLGLAFPLFALLWHLSTQYPLLSWVVHGANWLWIGGCLLALADTLRIEIKRQDTATQTLRSVSQGRAEIRGKVAAIGPPFLSPFTQTPCVCYDFSVEVDGETVRESHYHSFLLTDGERYVFVPLNRNKTTELLVWLDSDDAPKTLLREDLRGRNVAKQRLERLIPVGLEVQVNGVFVTLSSQDSYIETAMTRLGLPIPTEENLNTLSEFKDWREWDADWKAWVRLMEQERGQGEAPVPLNAMLPLSLGKRVPATRFIHNSWHNSLSFGLIGVAMMLPSLYFELAWFGVLPKPAEMWELLGQWVF